LAGGIGNPFPSAALDLSEILFRFLVPPLRLFPPYKRGTPSKKEYQRRSVFSLLTRMTSPVRTTVEVLSRPLFFLVFMTLAGRRCFSKKRL